MDLGRLRDGSMTTGAVTQGGVSLNENEVGKACDLAGGHPEWAQLSSLPVTVRPRALESHAPCPPNLHPLLMALVARRSQVSQLVR